MLDMRNSGAHFPSPPGAHFAASWVKYCAQPALAEPPVIDCLRECELNHNQAGMTNGPP